MFRLVRAQLFLAGLLALTGCAVIPQNPNYEGPPERPKSIDQYYAHKEYTSYREFTLGRGEDFTVKRIIIETPAGEVVTDFFEHDEKNDDLIFVFPLLGGKNLIPNYFATYFAKRGYDTAIVHRSEDFKKPEYFDTLEETLRSNVVRDRVAIDFFEKEYKKKDFGTFGISRGAINVAITASVDKRLKYNVLALGGSDITDIFKTARVNKFKLYREKIMLAKGITKEEFFAKLEGSIKTDPKYLAQYLDSRNTLMFLSMFDSTVPIKNGMQLRETIGQPRTVYMAADHFISAGFTGMGQLVSVGPDYSLFPFDYIESEALDFYESKFKKRKWRLETVPLRILQLPFNVVQRIVGAFL